MTIKIISESGGLPSYQTAGSAAVDLEAWLEEPVRIKPGETVKIPTGIYLDMSDHPDIFGSLHVRSSIGIKLGLMLANGTGIIDNDYQGEVIVALHNYAPPVQQVGMGSFKPAPVIIEPGQRIAQLVFQKYEQIAFEQVSEFETTTERGAGGIGSTGK